MAGKWEPCPRCGSKRVKDKPIANISGGLGVFCIVLGIWLFDSPFVFIVGIVLFTYAIIISIIENIKAKKEGELLECKDCEHAWRYGDSNNKSVLNQ